MMQILSTRKALALATLIGGCVLAAPAAHAQTITFEGYAPANQATPVGPTTPYTSAGFTFTPSQNAAAIFDPGSGVTLAGDSTAFFGFANGNAANTTITVTRNGGGTFDLVSLLLGPARGTSPVTFTLTGIRTGGTNETYTSGPLTTGTTATFTNFTNLNSVTIAAAIPGGNLAGFDNATLRAGAAAAVPEPSEYAIGGMFGATLLFGMVRAKRRSAGKKTALVA